MNTASIADLGAQICNQHIHSMWWTTKGDKQQWLQLFV